ncbi:MAG: DUF935 family protein [Magnetococcales bacterium]|nr:DUF935 family protein [Magnetococcales bacterium]
MATRLSSRISSLGNDPTRWIDFGLLPNPDRILRLSGQDQSAYERILGDSHVLSKVIDRRAGLAGREWRVDPAGDDSAAKKAAELCQAAVDLMENHLDHPLEEGLLFLQDAVFRGYRGVEVVWSDTSQGWLPEYLVDIPNRRLHHDGHQWRILTKKQPGVGVPIPPHKALVVAHMATSDNPYGEAILSRCLWPVIFKQNGVEFWARLAEKFGLPWVIASGVDQDQQAKVADDLNRMLLDAVAAISGDMELTTLEMKGNPGNLHQSMIRFCNAEISKVIVGQTLSTELDQKGGSRSAAETHAGLRDELVNADGKLVARAMRRLFASILAINEIEAPVPVWRWTEEDDPDPVRAEIAQIGVNITGGQVPKRWVWDNLGIPADMADEEMVGSATGASMSFDGNPPQRAFSPDQEAVEQLTQRALVEAAPAWADLREQFLNALAQADSYEAFSANLPTIMDRADLDAMTDPLFRGALNTHLFGQDQAIRDADG